MGDSFGEDLMEKEMSFSIKKMKRRIDDCKSFSLGAI
jgi:hypothetical protein